MINYNLAEYINSAYHLKDLPTDEGKEVAFVGRSNAGKSSAINTLTRRTRLAHTSKTPGRTQTINSFMLSDTQRLMDLPGYGYAKVAKSMSEHWHQLISEYLSYRESLQGMVVLIDCRHPLKDSDILLLQLACEYNRPVHIVLTKADKLKRGPASQVLMTVKKALADLPVPSSVQLFSALKRTGVDQLATKLNEWLGESESA